jgi:hypothetical protein
VDEIRTALAEVGVELRDDAYLFSNDAAHARPWNPDWVTHQIAASAYSVITSALTWLSATAGRSRMVVSGRPEDMYHKRPYSGKAGIGCFGRETLLSSKRGYRRTSAAAEERDRITSALSARTP